MLTAIGAVLLLGTFASIANGSDTKTITTASVAEPVAVSTTPDQAAADQVTADQAAADQAAAAKAVADKAAADKAAAAKAIADKAAAVKAAVSASKSDSSFKNGVLTTPDMKIKITDHKIIPVGKKGNEYGSKPVIAFWYKVTNLSGKKMSPMDWIFAITAYQDNNPNAENKLGVGSVPDERFLDSQMENIKKGGTVENSMAYELDDQTTPVVLVASNDLGMTEIGKVTYNLK